MGETLHVVSFSGGVGSWAAGKRVVEKFGTDGVVLLFADTLMEDPDLYRFLDEAAANIGAPLVRVCHGKTPWELFHAEKMMGNNRVDLCSRKLKRDRLDEWWEQHAPQATRYIGIDWSEQHRLERVRARAPQCRWEAPMCEKPYLTKQGMLSWLDREGVKPPRLYGLGFPHNNCGGFCVKAGVAHFLHLLKTLPDVYGFHENQERIFRENSGKDVSILRSRKAGTTKPLTLEALRKSVESQSSMFEYEDEEWGGCGCALE